jgi:ATP-dependent Zn protease
MRQSHKTVLLWITLIFAFVAVWQLLNRGPKEITLPFSSFLRQIEEAPTEIKVEDPIQIRASDRYAQYTWRTKREPNQLLTTLGPIDSAVLEKLGRAKVPYLISSDAKNDGFWVQIFATWLPLLVVIVLFFVLMRSLSAGGGRAMSFGKPPRSPVREKPDVTFADVIGVEDAKDALREIVDFLIDPKKFQRLGGRVRKGVLLTGIPGTGKTLLARAVAGEAECKFFSITGSDFVEMFVGVGASRVRNLFDEAKKNAPCVVFIDEIDAVGRHRGAGLGGGHDEREQTLNQLLSEMDGFEAKAGIVVIAATNRIDVLDRALLRPGRFDRKINVPPPDYSDRLRLLLHYTKATPVATNINLEQIAVWGATLTGADISTLVNEAAILAARRKRNAIAQVDLVDALAKIGHRVPDATDPALLGQTVSSKIVGQPAATAAVANALSMHYRDLRSGSRADVAREPWKPNVLLYGPTGSGKTGLVEAFAQELDVPFASVDAISLAMDERNFQVVLRRLLEAADNNDRRAQLGIIVIYALERLLTPQSLPLQDYLARIIEGIRFDVSVSDVYADRSTQSIHTGGIIFVGEATFLPEQKSISERLKEGAIGPYSAKTRENRYAILRKAGISPRLLDAFPFIEATQRLVQRDLRWILKGSAARAADDADDDQPDTAGQVAGLADRIERYFGERFGDMGWKLRIEQDALAALAPQADGGFSSARFPPALIERAIVEHHQSSKRRGDRLVVTSDTVDVAGREFIHRPLLARYQQRFKDVGTELSFEPAALDAIASYADARGGSARLLPAVIEEVLAAQGKKLTGPAALVTRDMIDSVLGTPDADPRPWRKAA